jgi:hypothetical protein
LGSDISCFLEHQEIVVGRGGNEVVGDLESDVSFSLAKGHSQGVGSEGGLEDVAGTEQVIDIRSPDWICHKSSNSRKLVAAYSSLFLLRAGSGHLDILISQDSSQGVLAPAHVSLRKGLSSLHRSHRGLCSLLSSGLLLASLTSLIGVISGNDDPWGDA